MINSLAPTTVVQAAATADAAERRTAAPAAQPAQAAQPAPQPANSDVPPMAETMESVVKQIESFLKGNERSLRFSVDEATGRVVISVRDAVSGDLIRQIPGEDAMRIARALANGAKSLLDLTV